jgi:hypothetical protein
MTVFLIRVNILMVKDNELCDREFYVNVAVMNAAKDSLTSMGISTPSQLRILRVLLVCLG